ncbi:cholinesterase [Myxocyprinus asiaticus]|uniref:cholinesterase n=1 Tax=Myxocyprinus asiaticus TaxID=70543 RepID=UPI002221AB6E|nr:cholinesterase [Myxocyprinus asiaticus]
MYDATYPRAACMQVNEDCLYLNVFVPLSVNITAPLLKPLPIMVLIHGGDFIAGSASKPLYDACYISNFTQTVVVGLGKDPRTSAVGNYGILDQQMALLGVQQNIAVFGGDPRQARVAEVGEGLCEDVQLLSEGHCVSAV